MLVITTQTVAIAVQMLQRFVTLVAIIHEQEALTDERKAHASGDPDITQEIRHNHQIGYINIPNVPMKIVVKQNEIKVNMMHILITRLGLSWVIRHFTNGNNSGLAGCCSSDGFELPLVSPIDP